METVKFIVAQCLSPLLISLILQCSGWLVLVFGRRRLGMVFIGSGTVLLLVGSFSGLTYESRRSREFAWPAFETRSIDESDKVLAVVAGTGFHRDAEIPANSQVGSVFLARLLEGVRIYRASPDVRLLVSVAGDAPQADKRKFLDAMVNLLKLDSERVELLADAESTEDEAQAAAQQSQPDERVVVVTSAGHLVRAMQIFAAAGMNPEAAPADYHFVRSGSPDEEIWPRWVPSTDGVNGNHQWLYEQTATAWHRLRN